MIMKPMVNFRDCNDAETFAITSGWVDVLVLTAGVAKILPVPAGSKYVLFNSNTDFWVKMNGVPVIPTVDILDGTAPEYQPMARIVKDVASIGVVSGAGGFVTLAFNK